VNVQFVLNLGYLDFEIVSDFSTGHLTVDIRISDFSLSSTLGGNSTCRGEAFWRRRVNQNRSYLHTQNG
jgi:hypothetical protein